MSAMPPSNAAAGHIEIVREIRPEGGMPEPHALAQTKEGGYVIGGVDHGVAVAMRIDASGRVQWRHMVNHQRLRARTSDYPGVAVLPDDSTVLCGWMEKEQHGVEGLLTHIDKDGNVISQRVMHPNQGDETLRVNYLNKCVPSSTGVAVVGNTVRFSGDDPVHQHRESFAWLLALDAKAEMKWEKLIPGLKGNSVDEVMVLPNQDLVIEAGGTITRIGPDGALKAQKDAEGLLVRQPQGGVVLAVLFAPNEHSTSLRILGEQFEVVKTQTGTAALIVPKAAVCALPDGSVAVFGFKRGPVLKASVSWIGADMNKQENLIFNSYGDSIWVSDAVPTGNPGEFAAIRPVIESGPAGSFNLGMVLSFVSIK